MRSLLYSCRLLYDRSQMNLMPGWCRRVGPNPVKSIRRQLCFTTPSSVHHPQRSRCHQLMTRLGVRGRRYREVTAAGLVEQIKFTSTMSHFSS